MLRQAFQGKMRCYAIARLWRQVLRVLKHKTPSEEAYRRPTIVLCRIVLAPPIKNVPRCIPRASRTSPYVPTFKINP